VAFSLSNLPGWTNVPLKDYFERALLLPTLVGNDANLAALGEHRFGAGRGCSDMIYITISTGIGGGVISDGKLFLGADGFAGELGHITIDPNGPRCNCGNVGCLEMLASGTAMAREARVALAAGKTSRLLDLAGGDPEAITAATVAQAFSLGDSVAEQIIHRAGVYIGIGVVTMLHLFNTRRVVLGGGVSNIGEPFFAVIQRTVKEYAITKARRYVRIVPAVLGDDVGLLGAAALVLGQQAK